MKANLTERFIKSIKPSEKAYDVYDQVLGGLILRVEKTGVMSFYVRYYNKEGKNNRTWLGHYGKITLTQAKDLAKQYLGAIAGGIDPQHQKKMVIAEAKKAKQDAITLKEFIDDVYTPWVKTNRKSGSHTLMLLDRYFSHWYSVSVQRTHPFFAIDRKGNNSSRRLFGHVGNFSKVSVNHANGSKPFNLAVANKL